VAEFSINVPAGEGYEILIPLGLMVLWFAGNLVAILGDLLVWLLVALSDWVRRPREVCIVFSEHFKVDSSGFPKSVRYRHRIRYGDYRLGLLERILVLFGLFRKHTFSAALPYEELDLVLIEVTRGALGTRFSARLQYQDKEGVLQTTHAELRPGSRGERIPLNDDGSGQPYSDYKLTARYG